MLELAQRGIDGDSEAHLTYSQGDLEIYPQGTLKRVLPDDLKEVIHEAGDPDELSNLNFSINQTSPVRVIDIYIGPGDWTEYTVESDDQTWALGRYHELTERLLNSRTIYAKCRSRSPQTLREDKASIWQPAPWELAKGWRIVAINSLRIIAGLIPGLIAAYIGLTAVSAYTSTSDPTRQDKQTSQQSLVQMHWIGAHVVPILLLAVSYIVIVFGLRRWFKTFLTSKVILRQSTLLGQFSFRGSASDPLALASFYAAVAALLVPVVVAIFIHG
jgi:hypothetical protein